MLQTSIVIVLVVCSVLHAGWALIPRAMRRAVALKVLALSLPLPGWLSKVMQSAAVAHSGCACHGCENATGGASALPAVVKAQPVVFHRKHGR